MKLLDEKCYSFGSECTFSPRLQPPPLDTIDDNGSNGCDEYRDLRFITLMPFYKYIFLKYPIELFHTSKERFYSTNFEYGPPYSTHATEHLKDVFFDEVSSHSGNFSLVSVHECLLLKMDPNINNKKDLNNRALHYVSSCRRRGCIPFGVSTWVNHKKYIMLANLLFKAKADVNARNALGETPIMVAAKGVSVVKSNAHLPSYYVSKLSGLLIRNGADIELLDRGGNTALQNAIKASNKWIVNQLLSEEFGSSKSHFFESKRHNQLPKNNDKQGAYTKHTKLMDYSRKMLGLAIGVRAKSLGMKHEESIRYFSSDSGAKNKAILNPSLKDLINHPKLCHPSCVIVEMLQDAATGKYESYDLKRPPF